MGDGQLGYVGGHFEGPDESDWEWVWSLKEERWEMLWEKPGGEDSGSGRGVGKRRKLSLYDGMYSSPYMYVHHAGDRQTGAAQRCGLTLFAILVN